MTKPLSEQVAELEAERDRLKADAISDLIKRHWLEAQVRNREAERDRLRRKVFTLVAGRSAARAKLDHMRDAAASWEGHCHEARAERDDLQRQVQETRDENDALRAGQGRWPGEIIASEDAPFKGMSDLRYKEPALPRVISAEELRAGMVVAWKVNNHHWGAGEVYDDGADALSEIRGITHIVLLEDAPELEKVDLTQWQEKLREDSARLAEVTATPRIVSDFPWCEREPLTVHALNVAPVGSRIHLGGIPDLFRKVWHCWLNRDGTRVTPGEILDGWPDATLTYPEQS